MPRRVATTQKHSVRINARLTAAEDAKLKELGAATGKDRSEIIRALIKGGAALRPAPPARPVWDQRALTALARISNNINQIARELHRRERQGVTPDEFGALDKALLQVVVITMAGPEAAREVMIEGLSAFMARTNVQRYRGPSAEPK